MTAKAGYRHSADDTTPDLPGEPASAPTVDALAPKQLSPALVTVEEAATYLAIGRSRMFELLKHGEIPSLKIGPQQRRIRVADLDRYIARRLDSEDGAR